MTDVEIAARRAVRAAWAEWAAPEQAELTAIRGEVEAILDQYRPLLAGLEEDLAPLADRLELLAEAVRRRALRFRPDLPTRPTSALELPDEDDWLFASTRPYWDQLVAYKRHRNGTHQP